MLTKPVTYKTTPTSTSPPADFSNMSEEDLRKFRRQKFGMEETTCSKTDEDLRKQRAERFNTIENTSEEEKKKLREKRFNFTKPTESLTIDSTDQTEILKRKERLKRFGTPLTQNSLNSNETNTKQKDWDSKILARQLRFGLLSKK
ncbi:uncharacterized protein LOC128882862 [Hylaeus volcanicus]|uniref:uncharacterized protein LOC128882862 n=1 Tax=Hylaeus volcanicus TaxID=313075 RepID=UPI0023B77D7B|nr:uncharacterized protein LOC128882862 [Hylaeus volcanicus]